jgi:hypothetical protein
MIKIDVVIPQNDIEAISEGLKKIKVGGITILKVKGRGKSAAPKIHASKGTEMFTPEFSDKYTLQVIVCTYHKSCCYCHYFHHYDDNSPSKPDLKLKRYRIIVYKFTFTIYLYSIAW